MKNIFKFMGIALMASALMVSCSKDKEEGGNNGGGNVAANTAQVTFAGTTWTAGAAQASDANYSGYGIMQYILFKTDGSYPAVNLMISGTPGTYTGNSEVGQADPSEDFPNGYNYYSWGGGYELYRVDYMQNGAVQTNNGERGDWVAKTAELTVTAFDLNTLTATFNVNAVMYDFSGWYYGDFDNATDAEEKDMTVVVNEYTFTRAQ